MAIFNADAWYSLTDEELEETLSCCKILILKAHYIDGRFRAAMRLWKLSMPKEARVVFQKEVFHPASVCPYS
jgi:hypothetical protein